MTVDLYIQAHKLQKVIDEQEAILKETKAEQAKRDEIRARPQEDIIIAEEVEE